MRQSLLVDVLDLGRGGQGAAPLATRAWIACVLAAPQETWGHPVCVRMPVRDFLDRIFLPGGQPRGVDLARRMNRLEDDVYRVRLADGRHPVAILHIPRDARGYVARDETMEFVVTLPQGVKPHGVPVDVERLRFVGVRSAPGYRALLNLYYAWHQHNRTLKPTDTRHWLQSHDPDHYSWWTFEQQVSLAYARQVIEERTHGHTPERTRKAWRDLARWGALTLIEDPHSHRVKLLPPPHFRTWPRPSESGR